MTAAANLMTECDVWPLMGGSSVWWNNGRPIDRSIHPSSSYVGARVGHMVVGGLGLQTSKPWRGAYILYLVTLYAVPVSQISIGRSIAVWGGRHAQVALVHIPRARRLDRETVQIFVQIIRSCVEFGKAALASPKYHIVSYSFDSHTYSGADLEWDGGECHLFNLLWFISNLS